MVFLKTKVFRLFCATCLTWILASGCVSSDNRTGRRGRVTFAPTLYGSTEGVTTFDAAWSIINESHFDTNFNGLNWPMIRWEFRPKAEAAKNVGELRLVIQEMLNQLGQSHMSVIPSTTVAAFDPNVVRTNKSSAATRARGPDSPQASNGNRLPGQNERSLESAGRDGDLGFEVRLLENRMVVTRVDPNGPAADAGVKPGWVVTAIDDQVLQEKIRKLPAHKGPQSAEFVTWRLTTGLIVGKIGTTAVVKFLNEKDQPVVLNLKRIQEKGVPVKFGYLPTIYTFFKDEKISSSSSADIGLIRFNAWMIPVAMPFDRAIDRFRNADGIIIDLRGNIGGIAGMVMGLSGHFFKEKVSLGKMKTRGTELTFFANPRYVDSTGKRVETYAGPVAILVDAVTLSAGEIFAGGMKDVGRARVFGGTTGGQALPALWDKLPNGDVLYHVFADYTIPSGERLERTGVVPDEMVPTTRKDLLMGRDAPMEAAIRWIDEERHRKSPQSADQTDLTPSQNSK